MMTIRTLDDLRALREITRFPQSLKQYIETEFLMLHEHLGDGTDLGTFDLAEHGVMMVPDAEDCKSTLKEMKRWFPCPSAEFVDLVKLADGLRVLRVGWLVDNDCCEMGYFVEQWLHKSVKQWLLDQAGPELPYSTQEGMNPF